MNPRSPVLLGDKHSKSVPVKRNRALQVSNIDPNVTEAYNIHHCPSEYFSDFYPTLAQLIAGLISGNLLDFVLDRRDRLNIFRDRQGIFTTHIAVAMRRSLNHIVHKSAHVIQVRLRTGE